MFLGTKHHLGKIILHKNYNIVTLNNAYRRSLRGNAYRQLKNEYIHSKLGSTMMVLIHGNREATSTVAGGG